MVGDRESMIRKCSLPLSVGEQGHCSGSYSHGNPSLRILWKQKFYMDSKVTGQVLGREIR